MCVAKELRLRAINLLARREHSYRELYRKLNVKELDGALIHSVLDELVKNNLLSDERFAEVYTRARLVKGYGPERISLELRERGVSDDLIESTLSPLKEQWINNLKTVWEKRWSHEKLSSLKERSKRWRFIQHRGYTWDQFKEVCEIYETINHS